MLHVVYLALRDGTGALWVASLYLEELSLQLQATSPASQEDVSFNSKRNVGINSQLDAVPFRKQRYTFCHNRGCLHHTFHVIINALQKWNQDVSAYNKQAEITIQSVLPIQVRTKLKTIYVPVDRITCSFILFKYVDDGDFIWGIAQCCHVNLSSHSNQVCQLISDRMINVSQSQSVELPNASNRV